MDLMLYTYQDSYGIIHFAVNEKRLGHYTQQAKDGHFMQSGCYAGTDPELEEGDGMHMQSGEGGLV